MKTTSYDITLDPPGPRLLAKVASPALPSYVEIPALLDTGSDLTLIPFDISVRLKLPTLDPVAVSNVTQNVVSFRTYLAELSVLGHTPIRLEVAGVLDLKFVILGRDFLNHFKVTLDGPNLLFSIE